MTPRARWLLGLGVALFLLLTLFMFRLALQFISPAERPIVGSGKDKIAIIYIEDVIYESERILNEIKKYKKNKTVRAVVIRINSPGGAVAPSQEIYASLKALKTENKKIIASMSTVAASGGYYIACAADTIVAVPGTITGSIGVIVELPYTEELFKKIGLKWQVIKSGEFKDLGSPHRLLNPVEKKLLQGVIDDTYQQFVEAVAESRKMSQARVRQFADGRIFTGRQARALGFVDTLGTFEDAIQIASKAVGIEQDPVILEEKKRLNWKDLILGSLKILSMTLRPEENLKILYQFKM